MFGDISSAEITQLLNQLLNVSPIVYATLIGGAAGVSAVTQLFKKWLKLKSDKVIVTLFTVISFIASGIIYIVTATDLPPQILGVSTITLMGIATPLYRFVIKPISNVIGFYKAYKPQIDEKLKAIEDSVIPQEVVAEAASYGVTPVVTTTPTPPNSTEIKLDINNLPPATASPLPEPQAQKEVIADF